MDMLRENKYYMRYSEGLDTTGVSDLASGWGYEETRTNQSPASSEHTQSSTFRLVAEASLLRLTGRYHIHLFGFLFI